MTEHSPTDEQQAIIEAMGKASAGSVMVEAGAGCAKSTTLKLGAKRIRVGALALAFGQRNAKDLARDMPTHMTVKTLNALGHGAWGRAQGQVELKLDKDKLGKLITQMAKERELKLDGDLWDNTRRVVQSAMQNGLVPERVANGHQGLVPDTDEVWQILAYECGLMRDEVAELGEFPRMVLEQSITLARQGLISFDDQIYCSTMLGGRFPKWPLVIVDENQDLSPLNVKMVELSLMGDSRIITCGDKRQGIFAWRGASGNAAELLRALRTQWTDLPLMTTFRCPKSVVARQQAHVPGYRAHHLNCEGLVRDVKLPPEEGKPWEPGWSWTDLDGLMPRPGAGIFMLCRNNAPLLGTALRLLRQGVGAEIIGRDIGKGLVKLSKKIASDDGASASWTRNAIQAWQMKEQGLAHESGHPERVGAIADRADCLRAVLDSSQVANAGGLRQALTVLFSKENQRVKLSSIHRAKGLEEEVVVLLDPWRIPSKQAKRAGGLQLEQELNLRYVAETRTRHTLLFGDAEEFHRPEVEAELA